MYHQRLRKEMRKSEKNLKISNSKYSSVTLGMQIMLKNLLEESGLPRGGKRGNLSQTPRYAGTTDRPHFLYLIFIII
jgi:hypothetical protein